MDRMRFSRRFLSLFLVLLLSLTLHSAHAKHEGGDPPPPDSAEGGDKLPPPDGDNSTLSPPPDGDSRDGDGDGGGDRMGDGDKDGDSRDGDGDGGGDRMGDGDKDGDKDGDVRDGDSKHDSKPPTAGKKGKKWDGYGEGDPFDGDWWSDDDEDEPNWFESPNLKELQDELMAGGLTLDMLHDVASIVFKDIESRDNSTIDARIDLFFEALSRMDNVDVDEERVREIIEPLVEEMRQHVDSTDPGSDDRRRPDILQQPFYFNRFPRPNEKKRSDRRENKGKYYVVVASGISTDSMDSIREIIGVDSGDPIGSYVSDNTYLVKKRLSNETVSELRQLDDVNYVGPRDAASKIKKWSSGPFGKKRDDPLMQGKGLKVKIDLEAVDSVDDAIEEIEQVVTDLGLSYTVSLGSHAEDVVIVTPDEGSVIDAEFLEEVFGLESIYTAEPEPEYDTLDIYTVMSTMAGVGASPLASLSVDIWERGLTGSGQVIGFADTGVDYDHCSFNDEDNALTFNEWLSDHRKFAAYWGLEGEMTLNGWNYGDRVDGVNGHGTHVVGMAAGEASMSSSPDLEEAASQLDGVAKHARLAFQDLQGEDGTIHLPADLHNGLLTTPESYGVAIHSNSWGCVSTSLEYCNLYSLDVQDLDTFVWEHPHFLVVLAVGNSGEVATTQTVTSPATAKNAIAVGSSKLSLEGVIEAVEAMDFVERADIASALGVDDCCSGSEEMRLYCCKEAILEYYSSSDLSGREQGVSDWSSRGPTFDGRIKPDVVAPGDPAVSAHSDGDPTTFQCGSGSPELGNDAAMIAMEGTSMSAPVVAGAAALIRQYFMDGFYPSGEADESDSFTPTAALMKAMIVNGATPLTGSVVVGDTTTSLEFYDFPDVFQGFGAVTLNTVLYFPDSGFHLYVDDPTVGLETGDSVTYCVTEVSGTLKVTLVWMDYPAESFASTALVNDLDLVVGNEETSETGNFEDHWDRRNNVEQVLFETSSTGTVTIEVRAHSIPSGPQPYALVVNGLFSEVDPGGLCLVNTTAIEGDAEFEDYYPLGDVLGTYVECDLTALTSVCSTLGSACTATVDAVDDITEENMEAAYCTTACEAFVDCIEDAGCSEEETVVSVWNDYRYYCSSVQCVTINRDYCSDLPEKVCSYTNSEVATVSSARHSTFAASFQEEVCPYGDFTLSQDAYCSINADLYAPLSCTTDEDCVTGAVATEVSYCASLCESGGLIYGDRLPARSECLGSGSECLSLWLSDEGEDCQMPGEQLAEDELAPNVTVQDSIVLSDSQIALSLFVDTTAIVRCIAVLSGQTVSSDSFVDISSSYALSANVGETIIVDNLQASTTYDTYCYAELQISGVGSSEENIAATLQEGLTTLSAGTTNSDVTVESLSSLSICTTNQMLDLWDQCSITSLLSNSDRNRCFTTLAVTDYLTCLCEEGLASGCYADASPTVEALKNNCDDDIDLIEDFCGVTSLLTTEEESTTAATTVNAFVSWSSRSVPVPVILAGISITALIIQAW